MSTQDPRVEGAEDPSTWLTRGVLSIGASSLGSDAGHEMTTSLLPSFLASTLHTGPGVLGVIEGVSDALVGLAKLAGGPLSADPRRRGRLASGGYVVTAIATAAIGLTTAVWQVAILRGLAWTSRGLRTPARDSLLTSLVPKEAYGRAAGVERAGDNAGALIGPLLAAALLTFVGIRTVMVLAFIPGLFAAVAITTAAHEAQSLVATSEGRLRVGFNFAELRRAGLIRALGPATLFELGNLATTLLILRATNLLHVDGRSLVHATSIAILLYAAHNAVAALVALVAGVWADRATPQVVFTAGAVVYVGAYGLFALGPHSILGVLGAFAAAGVGIGFAETAETTTVAQALPDRLRSQGFGLLGLIQSFGDLGATLVAGLIWSLWSPVAAFGYAGAWMLLSAALALVLIRSTRRSPRPPMEEEAR